jgi:NTE family protein
MPVAIAVRASAAVPLYYGAVFIDSAGNVTEHPEKDVQYNVYIDGGLLANYPINIFNDSADNKANIINKYTIGLNLERPEQIAYAEHNAGIAPYSIHSFQGYLSALYNLTIEQLNKNVSYGEEKKHTIYISTSNLSPRVRHITTEQKKLLFSNGEDAARKFFDETPYLK